MAINLGSNLTHTINKLRIIQVQGNSNANAESSVFSNFINNALDDSKTFEVQINPESYKREYKLEYYDPNPVAGATPNLNFSRVAGETLTINFKLDGTGVIPASVTNLADLGATVATSAMDFATRSAGLGGVTDTTYVSRRIEALKKVVYEVITGEHQPPTVKIVWGDVPPFKGKLDDLQINYVLFHPSGAPLRAEIQLQFSEHGESISQAAGSNIVANAALGLGASIGGRLLGSPDLTHRRIVKATDTLPLLCEEIYKDASFYWQVAEANNLTHFRELELGSELFFPPIER